MAAVRHFKELKVWQLAFQAAMRIFHLSKSWPPNEAHSLTAQIRRSSRSVCGNIAEAWRKRRYPNHFISKLTDADGEAAETENWLEFAYACGYIQEEIFLELTDQYEQITRGVVGMMNHSESWCGPASLVREPATPYQYIENAETDVLASEAVTHTPTHPPITS